MEKNETQALRDELEKCIKKTPDAVCNGSHQTAVLYKKWAATAVKLLANSRARDHQLQGSINQHVSFR